MHGRRTVARRSLTVVLVAALAVVGLWAAPGVAPRAEAAPLGYPQRVSVGPGGVQADARSFTGHLSADGRFVAFSSAASNLVAGPRSEIDVYLRDRLAGTVERVSLTSTGQVGWGQHYVKGLSGDGRFVLWASSASTLVPGDTNGTNQQDVFVRDRLQGTTRRVSVSSTGAQSNGFSEGLGISADGRFALFNSEATNLVAGDTNAVTDIFLHDLQTGETSRVSLGAAAAQANGSTVNASVSEDGRYVAFSSTATNLVPGDTNGVVDVFVRDRATGVTTRESVSSDGQQANGWGSRAPSISADGSVVAFPSAANSLVLFDDNQREDVFVRVRASGAVTRVSAALQYGGQYPVISGDGRFVAFESGVVWGNGRFNRQIFLYDRAGLSGGAQRVSQNAAGTAGSNDSTGQRLSADGRVVVWDSPDPDLVAGDTNAATDVFVREYSPDPVAVPAAQTYGCSCDEDSTVRPVMYRSDPVNTATGALSLTETDLRLGGSGVTFALSRSYTSADTSGGPLGPGWTHAFQASLLGAGTARVVGRAGDGQQTGFTRNPDGSYTADAGSRARLSATAEGYLLTAGDRSTRSFDAAGRLVGMRDRHGGGLTLGYVDGRLATVTDAPGRVVQFTHDAAGLLDRVWLPDGRYVAYTYSGGRLATVRDATGGVTGYGYDAGGRLATVTDPLGRVVVRTTYDAVSGRVVEQFDGAGARTVFGWDAATGTATTTEPRGGVWADVYRGNVLVESRDPLGNATRYGYDADLNVTEVTDPRGLRTSMTYDSRGNLLTRTAPAPLGHTERWAWTADDAVASHTDAAGATTTFSYDSAGRLSGVVDAVGGTTTTTYAVGEQVATVTDPRQATTGYGWDAAGNLASVTRPEGGRESYGYDSAGRRTSAVDPRGNVTGVDPLAWTTRLTYAFDDQLATVTDPRGSVTTTAYDLAGRASTVTDAEGGVTGYTYDAADRVATVTDARQGVTTLAWDATGNLTAVTTPAGGRTSYAYDLAGRRTAVTGPRGNLAGTDPAAYTTTSGYDPAGNVTAVSHPAAGTTTTEYDALGRPSAITDPLGRRTTVSYDAVGNVTSSSGPGGTVGATFDRLGRQLTTTDPRGKTTTVAYDAAGNRTAVTSPMGHRRSWTHDRDGRVTATVDPRGNAAGAVPADYTTSYAWDVAGNLTGVTDPLGRTTGFAWDAAGNRSGHTDPLGRTTGWTYDRLGQVTRVTDPLGQATSYTWDALGNLTARADALAHTTSYTFDADSRRTSVTDPLGRTATTAYDAAGNPTRVVTAAGTATPVEGDATISAAYDTLDRLTGLDYSDATPDVAYSYDALGRRQTMTDDGGAATYTYDTAGRPASVSRTAGGFAYLYDAAGHPTRRTLPDGSSVDATFDDDGRLASVTGPAGTTTFAYDAAGNLTATTPPAATGLRETRAWDRAGGLSTVATTRDGTAFTAQSVTRDAAGTPTAVTTTRDGATSAESYTHDAAGRLTAACAALTCSGASDTTAWTYDAAGNRRSEVRTGTGARTTTYDYDAADQLTTTTTGGITTVHTHDPDGRMTSAGARLFTWDLAGRLTGDTAAGAAAAYAYDGDGTRMSTTTAAGAITRQWYDPLGAMPELALETDALGGLLRRHLDGPAPLAVTTPTGTSWYARDAAGNVSDQVSAAGTPQWRFAYEPFGAPAATTSHGTGAPATPLGYGGQYRDPSGSYHLRARPYHPTLGRFPAPDPLTAPPGDPAGTGYAYAFNSPLVHADPTGQWPSLQNVSDFAACFGDKVTFGGTAAIRRAMAVDNVVNYDSGSCTAGEITGVVALGVATSGVGGTVAAGLGVTSRLGVLGVTAGVEGVIGLGNAYLTAKARGQCVETSDLVTGFVGGAAGGALGSAFGGLRLFGRTGANTLAETVLPKPTASSTKLQNVINDLYKGTTSSTRVGTGTTADAVRNELATGLPTSGTFHSQKAQEYSNALRDLLKQDLNDHDALVAQSLLDDLQRALAGHL